MTDAPKFQTIEPGYLEQYKDHAWLETFTGRQFYPLAPRRESVTIFDIAHALAYKCRYNGHSAKFYSVAEHSTVLALYARHLGRPIDVQYHLLMHDASEAYLPDVPRPIKHLFPDLVLLERTLDAFLRDWAGLSHEVPSTIKEFDSRIIRDERAQVLLPSGRRWQVDDLEPLGVMIHGLEPAEAMTRFLSAYQDIGLDYFDQPTLLTYGPGEFGEGHGDKVKLGTRDIRMIDLRGNCAWTVNEEGATRFLHGSFDCNSTGLIRRIRS